MKKIDLIIKGMHCKSCEAIIKDELADLGVKDCKIDFKSGKAEIMFDKSLLSLDSIKSAIKKLGYGVN